MATTITALDRGGFSAYGSATYDRRRNRILLRMAEGEERLVIVDLGATISSVATSKAQALTATSPSVSGSSFSVTLSAATAGAYVEFLADMASGEAKRVMIDVEDPERFLQHRRDYDERWWS